MSAKPWGEYKVRGLKLRSVLFVVLICRICCGSSLIFVDVDGPNDPGTGAASDPFRRIQDGIDACVDGDVIRIAPGVYTGGGNFDLDPNGKSVAIVSIDANDPNVITRTVIDPQGAGRGFLISSGEDANCVIGGLTIRNGYTSGSGGAIYCVDSGPTIRNCVFVENESMWGGGAVYCSRSDLSLENCLITGNSTGANGGGVELVESSGSRLVNCTVAGNTAGWFGDGAYCSESDSVFVNSIFWSNGTDQIYEYYSSAVVNYCAVEGGWPSGVGNISADPCFVSFDMGGDVNSWDCHLQSDYGRWDPNIGVWVEDSNMSLCIDSGDAGGDYSLEPWPHGGRLNMGAYGGGCEASKNGNEADFVINGIVNFIDYAEFAQKWGAQEQCVEDLSGNGVVDYLDLRIFVLNWLWER